MLPGTPAALDPYDEYKYSDDADILKERDFHGTNYKCSNPVG